LSQAFKATGKAGGYLLTPLLSKLTIKHPDIEIICNVDKVEEK
jgi:hypothetical protein